MNCPDSYIEHRLKMFTLAYFQLLEAITAKYVLHLCMQRNKYHFSRPQQDI